MSEHRWSGWPGAWCLDCGMENATESALCCPKCDLACYPGDPASDVMCPEHEAWARTPCPYPGEGRFDPYRRHEAAPECYAGDDEDEQEAA